MHLLHVQRTVSCILVLVIRHNRVLVPDANNDGVFGPGYSGSTTASSSHVCCVCFRVVLGHHKLLVAHSDTSCSWIPLSLRDPYRAIEFNNFKVLCSTVFELLRVFVLVEPWPVGRRCPARAIEAVNGGMLANIGLQVLVLFVRVGVLDPPDVRVPAVRHDIF